MNDESVEAAGAGHAPHAATTARRQETRERLFDAAMRAFAEVGLRGASVEAICAGAGFSRGAFYSNFSSKEQLFLALLEREYAQNVADLLVKAEHMEAELTACQDEVTPAQLARFVIDFLAPSRDEEIWYALELEMQLLAMRDPELIPSAVDGKTAVYGEITQPIERLIAASNRRFVIPIERALPILGSIYEDALRASMLGGPNIEGAIGELGERISEALFALTEPTSRQATGSAGNGVN